MSTKNPPGHPLRKEVSIALANSRGGQNAGLIAYQRLKRDADSHQLVALLSGGHRVAYFEPTSPWIVSYDVGFHHLDGKHSRIESRPEDEDDVLVWVREVGPQALGWLHTRFREESI